VSQSTDGGRDGGDEPFNPKRPPLFTWKQILTILLSVGMLGAIVFLRHSCSQGTAHLFEQMFPPPPPDAGATGQLPAGWTPWDGGHAPVPGRVFDLDQHK
jgi:hypothetical protein